MITPITKTVGKGLLLFSLMSMSAPVVLAQSQIKISGKVSSSTGEPLAGVTVQIKGVKNGTVTDGAGNYQILARDIDVLIFSLVGKEKAEVQVNKKDHINLVLQESSSLIDEVVVVGYGTQKKSNLTGALLLSMERCLTNVSLQIQRNYFKVACPAFVLPKDQEKQGMKM